MPIDRNTLSLAAEYAVASELCRRGIYAQLMFGNLKRTDLLVLTEDGNVARVEVKAKQKDNWPGCKGIGDQNSVIVFVDMQDKEAHDQPDFYILSYRNWKNLLRKKKRDYEESHPGKTMLVENGVPKYVDHITRSGKPYEGTTVSVRNVVKFKDKWEKIEKIVRNE